MRQLSAVLVLFVGVMGCGTQQSGSEAPALTNVALHVEGMMCEQSCAKSVEKVLAAQPGVRGVVIDVEQKQAICQVDPEAFDAEAAIVELADRDFVATVQ